MKALAVAPDGSWLVTLSHDGPARIWDAATGEQRGELPDAAGASVVAVAPDGSWLVTAGNNVCIWNAASGKRRAVLASWGDGIGWVWAVAVAPDGSWLVTASAEGAQIWDTASGEQRLNLGLWKEGMDDVAVAPDGSWLVTAGQFGQVKIWDAATGEQRIELHGTGLVKHVAVAPDGSWVVTTGYDGVRIWDAATGVPLPWTALGHRAHDVTKVAVAPDGTRLATVSGDGSVWIWDAVCGRAVGMTRIEHAGLSCAWGPVGQTLFVGGKSGLYSFAFRNPGRSSSDRP